MMMGRIATNTNINYKPPEEQQHDLVKSAPLVTLSSLRKIGTEQLVEEYHLRRSSLPTIPTCIKCSSGAFAGKFFYLEKNEILGSSLVDTSVSLCLETDHQDIAPVHAQIETRNQGQDPLTTACSIRDLTTQPNHGVFVKVRAIKKAVIQDGHKILMEMLKPANFSGLLAFGIDEGKAVPPVLGSYLSSGATVNETAELTNTNVNQDGTGTSASHSGMNDNCCIYGSKGGPMGESILIGKGSPLKESEAFAEFLDYYEIADRLESILMEFIEKQKHKESGTYYSLFDSFRLVYSNSSFQEAMTRNNIAMEDKLKIKLAFVELPNFLPWEEKSRPLKLTATKTGELIGEVRWTGSYIVPCNSKSTLKCRHRSREVVKSAFHVGNLTAGLLPEATLGSSAAVLRQKSVDSATNPPSPSNALLARRKSCMGWLESDAEHRRGPQQSESGILREDEELNFFPRNRSRSASAQEDDGRTLEESDITNRLHIIGGSSSKWGFNTKLSSPAGGNSLLSMGGLSSSTPVVTSTPDTATTTKASSAATAEKGRDSIQGGANLPSIAGTGGDRSTSSSLLPSKSETWYTNCYLNSHELHIGVNLHPNVPSPYRIPDLKSSSVWSCEAYMKNQAYGLPIVNRMIQNMSNMAAEADSVPTTAHTKSLLARCKSWLTRCPMQCNDENLIPVDRHVIRLPPSYGCGYHLSVQYEDGHYVLYDTFPAMSQDFSFCTAAERTATYENLNHTSGLEQSNQQVVIDLVDNIWLQILPHIEHHKLHYGDTFRIGSLTFDVLRYNIGFGGLQGYRASMEDEEVAFQDLGLSNKIPVSFFSIYDGHGGRDCASFLREELHLFFMNQLQVLVGHLDEAEDIHRATFEALYRSFILCDRAFLKMQLSRVRSCGIKNGPGGAAVTVAICGNTIWCANAGDARCVLCRGGQAIQLSVDHKPDRPDELERIHQSDGFVKNRRVLGRLAVSRAFGDIEYKNVATNSPALVIVDPEIRFVEDIQPDDEFLLLACDGLFDVYSSSEVVNILRNKLKQMPPGQLDAQLIVETIVQESIELRCSK